MEVFRRWGGQWNVTVALAPEPEAAGSAWKLVIRPRRMVTGRLSERAAGSLLAGESEAEGAWAAELRPLFDAALEAAREH